MARVFNGTSTFIAADAARVVAIASPFTISFWAWFRTTGLSNYCYSETSSTTTSQTFGIQSGTGGVAVLFRTDSLGVLINTGVSPGVSQKTWHHFCYTQDGSGHWQFYIDGSQVASSSFTPSGTFTTNRLTLGCLRRTSNTNFWDGTMGHVATWQRQLSQQEIQGLAAGAAASRFGPTHYWPLWGVDSPEPDIGLG